MSVYHVITPNVRGPFVRSLPGSRDFYTFISVTRVRRVVLKNLVTDVEVLYVPLTKDSDRFDEDSSWRSLRYVY